jgi:hypothetical protein
VQARQMRSRVTRHRPILVRRHPLNARRGPTSQKIRHPGCANSRILTHFVPAYQIFWGNRSKLPIFEIMRADWLRECLVFLALGAGLCAPSAVAIASQPQTATTSNDSATAAHGYFGILGEVACPGVYELPGTCTFGRLVGCAGGVTAEANGNARVLRGERVGQQLFVASSASAVLYPGDLIVIERDGTKLSATKSPGIASAPQPTPVPTEVQLAFLNLLDRPVVVRMPRDQASPARIVELLRQSPALVDDLRIVGPSRPQEHLASLSTSGAGLLASGSVLIFPPHRVRGASLPPLPDPIPLPKPQAILASKAESAVASTDSPPHAEPQIAAPVAEVASDSTESNRARASGLPSQEQIERLIYARRAGRSVSRMSGASLRQLTRGDRMREELEAARRPRARPYLSFFVLAGTAVLAMLVTIGSMAHRWINVSRAPGREQMACIVSPAPTLVELGRVSRPIRVDANLPQTRLGIDLAVFERARARQTQGSVAPPDPTPRAA